MGVRVYLAGKQASWALKAGKALTAARNLARGVAAEKFAHAAIKLRHPLSRVVHNRGAASYGLKGRPDFRVTSRFNNRIIRVYEIKTGGARLSAAQRYNQRVLGNRYKILRW